ncbi:hypothetical protein [Actinomadura montaniterrae]|uniref:Uncharacterized protein n=1 Tax=Actinomadura montaniterrae TaxID=1803903 RepID=A0A6L3VRM1_9ACTN|nr:hypothetical protein [Actinomadura montaniterrae]KAB2375403.1 hypothetical protein F9B16_26140 [Actinomadura montaniterrae]
MGHRANYVVVERGAHRVHYSQFGALSLGADPLMGPEELESYIRSLETREQLTDDVWCEGSLVLDLDTRTLLFWSEHCAAGVNLELRRALLRLVGELWPGWTVRWAAREHAEVVAHLGLAPEGLISTREPEDGPAVDEVVASLNEGMRMLGVPKNVEDQRREITEHGDPDPYYLDAETILTVRFGDGVVRDFSTMYRIADVLRSGAELVPALESAPGTSLPRVEHVRSGALIDVQTRTVTAWPVQPLRAEDHAERWPGWQVTWTDLGLPGQVAATGRDPVAVAQTPAHLAREAAALVGASDQVAQVQQGLEEHIAQVRGEGAEILAQAERAPVPPAPRDGRAELALRIIELYGAE